MSDLLKMVPIVLAVLLIPGVMLWSSMVYQQVTKELEESPEAEFPVSEFESPAVEQPRGFGVAGDHHCGPFADIRGPCRLNY